MLSKCELVATALVAAIRTYALLHHAHIAPIAGESYRLKDKRKAGSIKAAKNQ